MSEREKCCGTCRWHVLERNSADNEFVCSCADSDYYTDYTGYGDSCPDWEERI